MKLFITPGVLSVPKEDVDGSSLRGRVLAFRAIYNPDAPDYAPEQQTPVDGIDITDKAEWDSSNSLVLLFIGKEVVRDDRGRVIGSEARFRIVNPGKVTITAFAQGLRAEAKADIGVTVPMPTPVARQAPSQKHLWVGLGIATFALGLGIVGVASAGRLALPPLAGDDDDED